MRADDSRQAAGKGSTPKRVCKDVTGERRTPIEVGGPPGAKQEGWLRRTWQLQKRKGPLTVGVRRQTCWQCGMVGAARQRASKRLGAPSRQAQGSSTLYFGGRHTVQRLLWNPSGTVAQLRM